MLQLTPEDLVSYIDKPLFRKISAIADRLGVECYVIGGYVRDIFLERPSCDIDVTVVGSGIAVAETLCKELGKGAHLSIFKRFGTAQVKYHGQEIEFVGARSESYSSNSRKPTVESGTLLDDQRRRDFTINVLALCLNADRFGELVDPFDGLLDLQDKIIRTPLDPDITFTDDPLRMMRCVRFATQLGFFICDETFEALQRNAERIKIVSYERITAELNKILLSPRPSRGFVDLQRCGLLPLILPELSGLDMQEKRGKFTHKNNFFHTLEVLDNVAMKCPDNLALHWAALLHDIGKLPTRRWDANAGWTFKNHNAVGARMIKGIFRRMKLPMDERMKYVEKLVDLHMRPISIADDGVTDSAVRRLLFDAAGDIDDLMTLCEADITSRNRQRKLSFLENFRLLRTRLIEVEESDKIRNFQPPIDGLEIMQTFGLGPCREVGLIKSAIKDAILDGKVPNEHDAVFNYMMEYAASKGIKPRTEAKPSNA